MSYCVNCGVELGESEKKCPLCNVPVINPRAPFKEDGVKPYPKNTDTIKTILNRKNFIISLAILLLIPTGICLITDAVKDGRLSWSITATGGIFVWWILVTSPIIYRKNVIIRSATTDFFAVCGFLYLIEYMYKDTWFWTLGLPIAGLAYLLIVFIAYGIRFSYIKGLDTGASVLAAAALICGEIEFLLWILNDLNKKETFWSFYVIVPCLVIAVLMIFIERRKRLKKELAKRFHV